MMYLIPSWYKKDSWDETTQNWHARKNKSEYDDTIKQIQLFHRNKPWEYQIILLGHMPNLRHFLHRQGIFRANYWSCFDAISCIKRKKISMFSYMQLKWPEGIEFEYTPFIVIAYLNDRVFAKLEFGEDGNLIQIDMYDNDQKIRANYYDDRGFVGKSVVFENGKEIYSDYLMDNGIWKLREWKDDGHVDINQRYPEYMIQNGSDYSFVKYKQTSYSRIEEVIYEVLQSYVDTLDGNDMFCIAAHDRHMDIVTRACPNKKTILSFWEERNMTISDEMIQHINSVAYIVTDSEKTSQKIKETQNKSNNNIIDISPYDSRTNQGISRQIPVQKIMVPVDNLEDEKFKRIMPLLAMYMEENDKAEVYLFTRNNEYGNVERIQKRLCEVLVENGYDKRLADDPDEVEEQSVEDIELNNETIRRNFYITLCIDELAISRFVREQRILVDMREETELYIYISALSAGIPQIVMKESQYVEDGENGMILDRLDAIPAALDYYLSSLANWNEAMICSFEIGKKFSTDVLLSKWREVVKVVEEG